MVSAVPRSTRQLTALAIAAGLVFCGASAAYAEDETPPAEPDSTTTSVSLTPEDSPATTNSAAAEDGAESDPPAPETGESPEGTPNPTSAPAPSASAPDPSPSTPDPSPSPSEDPTSTNPSLAPGVDMSCVGTSSLSPGETVTMQCSASGAHSFALGTDISQLGGQVRMDGNQVIYTAPAELDTANTDVFTVISFDADGERLGTTSVRFTVYGSPDTPSEDPTTEQPPSQETPTPDESNPEPTNTEQPSTEQPGSGTQGPGESSPTSEGSPPGTGDSAPTASSPQEPDAASSPGADLLPVPGFPSVGGQTSGTATAPGAEGNSEQVWPPHHSVPADQATSSPDASGGPSAPVSSSGAGAPAPGEGSATSAAGATGTDADDSLARTGQDSLLSNATVIWALALSVLTVLIGGTAVLISRKRASSR